MGSENPENARWFVEEVHPHGSSLRAYLRSRFPWLTDVDDIAQEAFFRLWRRRQQNQDEEVRSSKAALYAIARNAVLDLGRRRNVVEISSVAEIEQLSVLDERVDVAETVSTRQELEFLAEALRDLPDRCRQVLTLCKMYGYTPKEVAERLGISEHTVRAQIAKGMRRCAAHLRHQGVGRESGPTP
ncbi:MAG: RNA polymerase sigma factor [Opitutae bacterium]|nr:RNA polymerase sigma factor [Opitutae bacterium]